ncbi:hypothetical protein [Bacillus tropicus]|uniref:hypothetical protein n=1 Tax=Bacillus tropicus TaxID=2026188 RepID=UPI001CFCE60B|nr:hypothetical protein [Bacillus tropicus]
MKNSLITGEDTFFITLLATWLSVRINEWGAEHFLEFFILIIGILTFSILLAEIRHAFSINANPSLFNESSRRRSLLLRFLLILLLVIIVLYFTWNNKTYLQTIDKYIFCGIAILWSAFLIYEKISDYKFKSIKVPSGQDITQGN